MIAAVVRSSSTLSNEIAIWSDRHGQTVIPLRMQWNGSHRHAVLGGPAASGPQGCPSGWRRPWSGRQIDTQAHGAGRGACAPARAAREASARRRAGGLVCFAGAGGRRPTRICHGSAARSKSSRPCSEGMYKKSA